MRISGRLHAVYRCRRASIVTESVKKERRRARVIYMLYSTHRQTLSLLITLSRSLCSLANKSNTCHVVNVARHVRSLSNNNSPWRSHMAFCCCCYSCYCFNFEFVLFFSVYQLAHSITNCIKRTAPSPWYNATDCPNFSHCSSVRQSRSIRSVGERESEQQQESRESRTEPFIEWGKLSKLIAAAALLSPISLILPLSLHCCWHHK